MANTLKYIIYSIFENNTALNKPWEFQAVSQQELELL